MLSICEYLPFRLKAQSLSPHAYKSLSSAWLCDPMDHSPPGPPTVTSPVKNTGVGYPPPEDLPGPVGLNLRLLCYLYYSGLLPLVPPGKSFPPHPPYTVGIWVPLYQILFLLLFLLPSGLFFFLFSQARILRPYHILLQSLLSHKVSRTMSSSPFTHLLTSWTQNEGKFLALWIQGLIEEV